MLHFKRVKNKNYTEDLFIDNFKTDFLNEYFLRTK